MRTLFILLVDPLSRAVTLWGSSRAKLVLAEDLMLEHQRLVIQRSRSRAPHRQPADRLRLGLLSGIVERLIGTLRREYLDQLLFWNAQDLERKPERFRTYFNSSRVHHGLDVDAPDEKAGSLAPPVANLAHYHRQSHCPGLFQLPVAA